MSSSEEPESLRDLLKRGDPQSPALISSTRGISITYAQLSTYVSTFASDISASISRESVVAFALPNGLELAVAFLGVGAAGCVAAPLNPAYTQAEFEFYLTDSASKFLLLPHGYTSATPPGPALAAARKLGVTVAEVVFEDGKGAVIHTSDSESKSRGTVSTTKPSAIRAGTLDNVALILHTSGTTGKPKAVPLTHRNLLTSTKNISATYDLGPQDRTYLVQVLFHIHGIVAPFLSTLASGGSIVLPDRFDPSKTWFEFTEHKCTWITAVPSILQILLHARKPSTPLKIRFIRSCSSPLPPATFNQLEKAFNTPVLEAYAMTEAAHQMTSNTIRSRRPGSVGFGQGVEVRICDEAGVPLRFGVEGEVCVRGANVTPGYINNPAANASAFISPAETNGEPNSAGHGRGAFAFFRTGDRGYMDPDGRVTLVGRISEIINRGGEKISPFEVDSALLNVSPAILEAVCFAVPDELLGQEVEAAVVLDLKHQHAQAISEERIQKVVRETLAEFKVPKRVHFCEGAIPKGPTGKIQRKNLAGIFNKPPIASESSSSDPNDSLVARKALVKTALASVLNIPIADIKDDVTLFQLGADSLSFIRLATELKKEGYTIKLNQLFRDPTISSIPALLERISDATTLNHADKVQDPDPEPFSLLGATTIEQRAALQKDIAKQVKVRPEDVEDAFPLAPGQHQMRWGLQACETLPLWWIADAYTLNLGVDVETWKEACKKTVAAEPSLRNTFFQLAGNDQTRWGMAQLSPTAAPPIWLEFNVDTYKTGIKRVSEFYYTLRHTMGMNTIYFVLVRYDKGIDFYFLCSHMCLEGASKLRIRQHIAYNYLNPTASAGDTPSPIPPWSRYLRSILAHDTAASKAYWAKALAVAARIPSYWKYTGLREDVNTRPAHALRHDVTVDNLDLGRASLETGVSIPVFVEAVFALSLGVYWSQRSGETAQLALYMKPTQNRPADIPQADDIRGLTLTWQSALFSLMEARTSIWSFIKYMSMKMRSTEDISDQTVLGKDALTPCSVMYNWRFKDSLPGWDELATTKVTVLWRPTTPITFVIHRVGRDGLNFSSVEDDQFISEQRAAGCTVPLLEVFRRTLLTMCKTSEGLEHMQWDQLRQSVLKGPADQTSKL